MPVFKCTSLFQCSTTVAGRAGKFASRLGGWSESWYYTTAAITDAILAHTTLNVQRARLLGASSAIIGQRYQQVDPVGGSTTRNSGHPGGAELTDMPQLALLVSLRSSDNLYRRSVMLRGWPDDWTVTGELNQWNVWGPLIDQFMSGLNGWSFRVRSKATPTVPIQSISPEGLVVTNGNHGLIATDRVRILRPQTTLRRSPAGVYWIYSITNPTTFTLRDWPNDATATSGQMRKEAITYAPIGLVNWNVRNSRVRKVGRPFEVFSGRAGTRR